MVEHLENLWMKPSFFFRRDQGSGDQETTATTKPTDHAVAYHVVVLLAYARRFVAWVVDTHTYILVDVS